MNPTYTALLFSFVGTTLLVIAVFYLVYEVFFRYPASVRQRLNAAAGLTTQEKKSLLLDIKQLAESASKAPNDWRHGIRDLLEQSGLSLDTRTFFVLSAGTGIVMALAATVVTRQWWTTALGLLAGLTIPLFYVLIKRRARLRQMTLQLPDALDVICRAVRAGQTVPASLQLVADDFPPPISEEFRYCYEQQNLGISYNTALHNMARSTGIMELRLLVVALLVQTRSGGNLTELLHNLAAMVRKRLVIQQKVRSLTGEGRMQASVLIALPILAFAAIFLLNRDYAEVLLDYPWVLAGCALSQAVGAVFIKRLVRIEY